MALALNISTPSTHSDVRKYHPTSSEEELIAGCRQRDRLAQKYLYERYFGKMLGISMRYTNNREEAVEVLNIAFMKVFCSIDSYKPTGSFGGWIARIVFNSSIDFVRSNTTYRKVIDLNTEREKPIDNPALDNLAMEELYAIIQELPPASRTVFSMYVIDGYKHHEIAERLDISVGTSKWHLSNARKSLQEKIKKYINR